MRAMSSATIQFGLVSIPVKLYSASESSASVRFNQIHKTDGSRVKQQLISAKTGEPVPKDEIVKGYEFAKGQYVLFTPEELKALEADATHAIDIEEFIPADQIDRIYVEKIYYLGPDKGGNRAYRLLSEALRETGRVGLARYAARGKQYLVAVRPQEEGLAMDQLRYADEIRSFSELRIDDAEIKKDELKLAVQLVEQLAVEKFKPEKYRDEVRERVLELIQKKVDGEDISVAPSEQPQTKIIDMMEALKASLASGEKRKPARRAGKRSVAKRETGS